MTEFLTRPRALPAIIMVSLLIGIAHCLLMLPVGLILGTSDFWTFPVGTVPGGGSDMGQAVVGYRYFVQSPWTWPLLNVAQLVPPKGTNLLWMDAAPIVSVIGKLLVGATGHYVNLLGLYLFLCFALPGALMAMLVWLLGQRSLFAAVASAAVTSAAPFLLAEWGHITLCGQFLLIAAFIAYVQAMRYPRGWPILLAWLALLLTMFLLNIYMFVMIGGIWAASLVQRWRDGACTFRDVCQEACIIVAIVIGTGIATGIVSSDLRSAGTGGFGMFSMNLASPFIPQRSGVIWPLRDYFLGSRSQVFDYVGLGALLLMLCALPPAWRWLRYQWRAHVVLLLVLMGFWALALSHKITLGGRVILTIPLPDSVLYALGTFRASGRFFWPLAYIGIASVIVLVLRSLPPARAVVVLLIASVLQVLDINPARMAVAQSARQARPAILDRGQLADVVRPANAVMILPHASCLLATMGDADRDTYLRVSQSSMEIELAASHALRPINSAFTARDMTDCSEDATDIRQPLQPGIAYFYLTDFQPGPDQLHNHNPDDVCKMIGSVRTCSLR